MRVSPFLKAAPNVHPAKCIRVSAICELISRTVANDPYEVDQPIDVSAGYEIVACYGCDTEVLLALYPTQEQADKVYGSLVNHLEIHGGVSGWQWPEPEGQIPSALIV